VTHHLSRLGITHQDVLQMRANLLVAIRRANNDKAMK
jgi:hypothetical protein